MQDRICGNCGYPLDAQWDNCPECGRDRAQQTIIATRRHRFLQIRWIVPSVAGVALAPGLLILPLDWLGVPQLDAVLWLLELLALPVSAVLWGGMLDFIEPGRNSLVLLLLGIVLGAASQFAGLLAMAATGLAFA